MKKTKLRKGWSIKISKIFDKAITAGYPATTAVRHGILNHARYEALNLCENEMEREIVECRYLGADISSSRTKADLQSAYLRVTKSPFPSEKERADMLELCKAISTRAKN